MAASSSSSAIEIIDVEAEFEKSEYQKKLLKDNFIYIPEQYYRYIVKCGLINDLVKIINDVNEEEEKNKRILYLKNEKNIGTRSPITTTTNNNY